jgi:hypothetical protein
LAITVAVADLAIPIRGPAQAQDEDGIQAAIEDNRDDHEPQRRHGIARVAHSHHHQHQGLGSPEWR